MWVSNGGTRVFHMRESKKNDENCNFYSVRVFQNAKKVISSKLNYIYVSNLLLACKMSKNQ